MIKGNLINLRLIKNEDLDEFIDLYNDIENRGPYYYMGLEPESQMRKQYAEYGFWNDNFMRMLIVSKEDEMLGYINCFKSVPWFKSYEIGYRLFRYDWRKKGVMTEAVKLFSNYLFISKDINRLEIRTHPNNKTSQRIALKNGFIEEGNARGALFYNKEWVDVCQFAKIRQDHTFL